MAPDLDADYSDDDITPQRGKQDQRTRNEERRNRIEDTEIVADYDDVDKDSYSDMPIVTDKNMKNKGQAERDGDKFNSGNANIAVVNTGIRRDGPIDQSYGAAKDPNRRKLRRSDSDSLDATGGDVLGLTSIAGTNTILAGQTFDKVEVGLAFFLVHQMSLLVEIRNLGNIAREWLSDFTTKWNRDRPLWSGFELFGVGLFECLLSGVADLGCADRFTVNAY